MLANKTICRRRYRRSWLVALVVAPLIFSLRPAFAEEPQAPADKPNDPAEAVLKSHLSALKVSLADAAADAKLQVAPQRLLKYSDPARSYLAAGVWRIGLSGRPKGLVVLELWPHEVDSRQAVLHYELSSFQPGGLVLTGAAGVDWRPRESVLEFQPLENAPAPAETAARRLRQMKQLAKSFAIKESYHGDVSVLRLLEHPMDRYEDDKPGIVDGAMFAFAYGTNPELVLLLECDAKVWQFAVARLGGAELTVKRGDGSMQVFPELSTPAAPHDAYTAQTITVLLPQAE